MKRQLLCSAVFFSAFTFLVTPAQAQGTGTCCGKVGVGTTTFSDGSGSGGQELFLDVAGAAGATYYCDENGLNCFTASSLSGGVADDSLDFTKFLDAMALDASTSITADNAEVLSIVNTGTGNSLLVEDQATDTTPFVIDAAGNLGIGLTAPSTIVDVLGPTQTGTGSLYKPLRVGYSNSTIGITNGDMLSVGASGMSANRYSVTLRLGGGSDTAHNYIYGGNNSDYINISPNASAIILATANVERMRAMATGIGIGTTSPSSLLDVQKVGTAKANTDIFEITNSGNAADMDGTTSSVLFNQFYYDATTPAVADAAQITVGTETDWTSTASTQDSYLAFSTALDGTVAEKMRITSGGNVGIGTIGPDRKLDVLDASNPQMRLTYTDGSVYTDMQTDSSGNLTITPSGNRVILASSKKLRINGASDTFYSGIDSNAAILTAASGTGLLITDNNAGYLTGTASLRINNVSGTSNGIRVEQNSTGYGLAVGGVLGVNIDASYPSTTAPAGIGFKTSRDLYDGAGFTSGSVTGFISGYRSVNSGSTSPTTLTNFYHFRANGNTTAWADPTKLFITNQYGLYIDSLSSYTSNSWGIYQTGSSDKNYFAGNVGVGTTSPTEKFDVNSDTMRLRTAKTPASASDTCDQGEIAWDADYVYVCVATNTWKRSGLATW